ncbi:beta-phosphoglucomutase [Flavobacteriaceae bacterium]|nr:beta-phosphoglucomutase [Flavobacteriaceae bacterium]
MNRLKKHRCALFDLDGVIVDTAKYHFLAWKKIAAQCGYELTLQDNEQLKGVSRPDSLNRILEMAGTRLDETTFESYLHQKNKDYLQLIQEVTPEDILPGVQAALNFLKLNKVKIGLGSASKNALIILEKLQITSFFEVIIYGNSVQQGKPHPEVFLKGSNALGEAAEACVVFEDSQAGIDAAKAGGMTAVALGDAKLFKNMDYCYPDFEALDKVVLQTLF